MLAGKVAAPHKRLVDLVRHGRLVHRIDVEAVDAVLCEVLELLDCVGNACLCLLGRVVSCGDDALDHGRGNGCPARECHARDLLLARERHDAHNDGNLDAATGAEVAEALERLVVEEELRHEEVGAGILLALQVLERSPHGRRLHVSLRIAGSAEAELGVLCLEVGDEV